MAENESAALDGSERKLLEEAAIRNAQAVACPISGRLRGGIESIALFQRGRDESIVVATDIELRSFERPHRVEHLVRLGAIADKIAETCDAIVFFSPHAAEHRPQRFGVGVQVADDNCPHDVLRARFFGNSRRIRSTISIGVSSSRMSMVASHIR